MEQQTGSKLGKESVKAVYCHPVEYIIRNAGLDEAEAGIKIARRNINKLIYADDTTLMGESKEELKSLLMRAKEERTHVYLWWIHFDIWQNYYNFVKFKNKIKLKKKKSWLKAQHSENKDHGIWSHHFMENRWINSGNSGRL